MAEFFIARSQRRLGIGQTAVQLILNRFAGRWEINEYLRNPGAVSFWRRVVAGYTRGSYQERIVNGEVRQVFDSGRTLAFERAGAQQAPQPPASFASARRAQRASQGAAPRAAARASASSTRSRRRADISRHALKIAQPRPAAATITTCSSVLMLSARRPARALRDR